ncbi:ImmA/IrrE family metallo-endopeptidase [Listeria booriae]|uniref:ImmA/IrrE family metallo-endopeptidase n=1 Tax=Listeria booriae TaxID=1552123 RepID=UPI0021AE12AE|nr:ImmA/IrrE family metallo-endopeptidase [Listeria booriae]
MWVEKEVAELINKHGTNDPFELCDVLGILLIGWDMHEEMNGIYKYLRRNKLIYYNNRLPDHRVRFVIAHELAHAVLHPNSNAAYLKNTSWTMLSKAEKQAHEFATHLLLHGVNRGDYETKKNLLSAAGIPVEMERFI